jgi:hypothetical protein
MPSIFRDLVLFPLLVLAFSGCGIITQGFAEPNLSWNMHRDPERITQWTLAQTDMDGIFDGCQALRWVAATYPSKCDGACAGYVKVYRKVERGWPTGAVDTDYLWIMRDRWAQLVDSKAPKSVMDTYKQIGPPGEIPPSFQKARSHSLFKRE